MCTWSNLPLDLLAKIFSHLSPESLARARSTCKNWHTCANSYPLTTTSPPSPWFLALPIGNHGACWYVHNPVMKKWHQLSHHHFLPPLPSNPSIRPLSPIGSLLLLKLTNSTTLHLALCNPFTSQFKHLPRFHLSRTNPAVGVTTSDFHSAIPPFRIYVAGGMSEAPQGGATYEPDVEMYDSRVDAWQVVGSMPVEFAVRLTVWTPNESVWVRGTLYWITSARAYSVIGFDVDANRWKELGVPMAERLEFATLVKWNGALGLVGGTCGESACIWELSEGEKWCMVDKVPLELGLRFLSGKRSWENVRCVGNEGIVCLYRELGSGMLLCKSVARWEWVDGCAHIKGKQVPNCQVRGTLVPPYLAPSLIF